jgi:acetyl esterase
MLHPHVKALLSLIEQSGIQPLHTLTPAAARALYKDRKNLTQPEPPEVGDVRELQA